jgi:hypothetical protein
MEEGGFFYDSDWYFDESNSTVLPTPRSPTIKILLLGRPKRIRCTAIRTSSRSSLRPANSGGGAPASLAPLNRE